MRPFDYSFLEDLALPPRLVDQATAIGSLRERDAQRRETDPTPGLRGVGAAGAGAIGQDLQRD